MEVFTVDRGNNVHVCGMCVCHLLEGASTNADYMTDGTAVLDIMNAIAR